MTNAAPNTLTTHRSPRALWSLITGLIGVILNIPFVPGFHLEVVLGVAAIVLGGFGIHDARHGMRGSTMAVIGVVLGLVSLAAFANSSFGLVGRL